MLRLYRRYYLTALLFATEYNFEEKNISQQPTAQ